MGDRHSQSTPNREKVDKVPVGHYRLLYKVGRSRTLSKDYQEACAKIFLEEYCLQLGS